MNRKAFPLDNYFLYFSDHLLDLGQQVLDANKIRQVGDSSDGLYIFQVRDGQVLEVEILMRRKTVASCTCECQPFLESQNCEHVVAALKLLLRNQERLREERKKEKSAPPKRVGIKNLLSHFSDQELRAFVTHYGRTSSEFSLALRTQFADRIVTAANHLKYYELIRRYAIQIGMRSLNITKAKKFARYTNDLILKSDDLLSTGDFREAFYVLYGLTRYFELRSLARHEGELLQALYSIYDRLDLFFKRDFAPTLRKELLELLWELTKQDYHLHDPTKNLFYLIYTHGTTVERKNCLAALKHRTKISSGIYTLICYLHLLLQQDDNNDQVKDLFRNRRYRLEELTNMLQVTFDLDHKEIVASRARELYEDPHSSEVKRLAFRFLVKSIPSSDAQIKWYVRYFLEEGIKEVYLEAREKFQKDWTEILDKVITGLIAKDQSELLAFVYVTEGEKEPLLQLVRQAGSLDFILKYAPSLYPAHAAELTRLIQARVIQYLESHVGFHSIKFVEDTLTTLHAAGMNDIAENCRRVIREKFGDRMFLGKSLKSL